VTVSRLVVEKLKKTKPNAEFPLSMEF